MNRPFPVDLKQEMNMIWHNDIIIYLNIRISFRQ